MPLLSNVFLVCAAVVVQDFRVKNPWVSWRDVLAPGLWTAVGVRFFVFSYPTVRVLTHIQIYTFNLVLGDRRRRGRGHSRCL